MELQFFGANCLKLTTKKASLIIDDNLAELKGKSITKADDIALWTLQPSSKSTVARLTIAEPGEFEVSDISVQGISARAHTDEPKQKSATMYRLVADDVRIGIIGHVFPDLSDQQLEALGTIDVLCIPVGGNGFTLDGIGALKLIKKIEPKIVIPTYYDEVGLTFPVPPQDLQTVLKNMAMEPAETLPKLKVKVGEFTDTTRLIVLETQ